MLRKSSKQFAKIEQLDINSFYIRVHPFPPIYS